MQETIYAIVNEGRKEAYVGKTSRTLEERWLEHLHGAADAARAKTLYEALRHDPQDYEILECECSETASEAEWVKRFEAEGYRMLNESPANKKPAKRRDLEKEKRWRDAMAYGELHTKQEYSPPWK